MDEREKQIAHLFAAELQFRLACAVRLAATNDAQPLDLPQKWIHGNHQVEYEEIALRPDQAARRRRSILARTGEYVFRYVESGFGGDGRRS